MAILIHNFTNQNGNCNYNLNVSSDPRCKVTKPKSQNMLNGWRMVQIEYSDKKQNQLIKPLVKVT